MRHGVVATRDSFRDIPEFRSSTPSIRGVPQRQLSDPLNIEIRSFISFVLQARTACVGENVRPKITQ